MESGLTHKRSAESDTQIFTLNRCDCAQFHFGVCTNQRIGPTCREAETVPRPTAIQGPPLCDSISTGG